MPQLSRSSFWKPAVAVRAPESRPSESEDGPRTESSTLFEAQSPVEETEAILFALARAVEQRDQHTWGHCERLALISVTLGVAMGVDQPAWSPSIAEVTCTISARWVSRIRFCSREES